MNSKMGAQLQTDNLLHDVESDVLRAERDTQQIPSPPAPTKKRRSRIKLFLVLAAIPVMGGIGAAVYYETETSWFQSQEISRYAAKLTYSLKSGPTDTVIYPQEGPFDERLGYVRLPKLLERLRDRGMLIEQQAEFSPALMDYTSKGLFAPYLEKSQAGLAIADCGGEPMYNYRYPQQGYADFESIPPLIAQTLLFIENRDLLNPEMPNMNPAVDWGRFSKAVFYQAAEYVGINQPTMGGSTLATQIEKYRHSPDGVTSSAKDKLVQMASASVRAYQNGPNTLEARRNLVLSYLNTVPLSAAPGYGEVNGLGDGLKVWFGADFEEVNRLLSQPDGKSEGEDESETLNRQGLAMRQIIALMIAHRRPSYYLAAGRDELAELTDSYLRLMAKAGDISERLRDAALAQTLNYRDFIKNPAVKPMVTNKGINVARTRLSSMLNVPLYDLDRMDLSASTTLQRDLQEEVSTYLKQVREPEFAEKVGLFGERLLTPSQVDDLHYSFTLFESTPDGNRVRVQTDNTDQPFDINEGSKLELGSTAKIRVLTTYLEIMAEIHQSYADKPVDALRKVQLEPLDALSRWGLDYLATAADKSLPAMLDAALERRYSASPQEAFFTGGGMHTFNNFRKEDDGRIATVRESLQESLNLPFVRMMRDIMRYSMYKSLGSSAELLGDDKNPRRQEYLARFADREGLVFLQRFWRKYQNKDANQRLDTFLDTIRATPVRLAAAHRYLFPEADTAEFGKFLRDNLPEEKLSDKRIAELHKRYGPGAFNLQDQSYVARVHPLELWLLGYLQKNPAAKLSEASEASRAERQAVYSWLFRTRAKNARDSRIRTMLEIEAFTDIHQRWKRLGYPFDHLVPSLATALGSSGDRPAALAELMGIIVNDGVRLPTVRITDMHFAANTPYEAKLQRQYVEGERVMAPEVAAALRGALAQVVNDGTARRLQGSFALPDGTLMTVGGKTGTGDNRLVTVGAGGQRITSRALNRTATFVFYLGEKHFGTLTAFVPGREAAAFRFTSALPVQVLKGMAPILQPYLEPGRNSLCGDVSSVQQAMVQN